MIGSHSHPAATFGAPRFVPCQDGGRVMMRPRSACCRVSNSMRLLVAIIVLCVSIDARAQGPVGMPEFSADDLAQAAAACEQLGKIPNAPMSVEACRAMLGMVSQFGTAASDPSARRPGDESMSCAQIFAELQTIAGVGISDATAARSEGLLADATATTNRQAAEIGAFMVESQALGAAVGIAAAFTPNFVGAAISAAWQARAMSLGAKQAAEQTQLRARTNEALAASIDELSRSMQANPRFARLAKLGVDKRCEPPKDQ